MDIPFPFGCETLYVVDCLGRTWIKECDTEILAFFLENDETKAERVLFGQQEDIVGIDREDVEINIGEVGIMRDRRCLVLDRSALERREGLCGLLYSLIPQGLGYVFVFRSSWEYFDHRFCIGMGTKIEASMPLL